MKRVEALLFESIYQQERNAGKSKEAAATTLAAVSENVSLYVKSALEALRPTSK